MFNIVQVKGDDAGGYYGLQANYYLGGQAVSNWIGQGAAEIGLKGVVKPGPFTQLMNGEVPVPGKDPVQVLSGVRKGWDMTVSAPKWASLMMTLGGDKRLLAHWRHAAQSAFDYVERFATYRKSVKGVQQDIVGARLIGGAFLHDANRSNEPSIHVHLVSSAIGLSKEGQFRAVDLQHAFKHAKLLGQLVHAQFLATARRDGYQLALDEKGMAQLQDMPAGLHTVSEALSTRGQDVRAEIDRLGIATRQGEVAVVRATRETKTDGGVDMLDHASAIADAKGFGPDAIAALSPEPKAPLKTVLQSPPDGALPAWLEERLIPRRATISLRPPDRTNWGARFQYARNALRALTQLWNKVSETRLRAEYRGPGARGAPLPTLPGARGQRDAFAPLADYPLERLAARHELAFQIRRLSERQAAFTLHEVVLPTVISGLERNLKGVSLDNTLAAARDLEREGLIAPGRDRKQLYRATALEVEREQRILAFARSAKGQGAPILNKGQALSAIRAASDPKRPLTRGQKDLAQTVLTTKDRFATVQGFAGTGKTTAIRTLKPILAEQGLRLYGVANTRAARDELKSQGIEARTTASFVKRYASLGVTGALPRGERTADWANTVLIFDEASFSGNADKEAFLAIAQQLNARLILSMGDKEQLPAIKAGNVPALMERLPGGFHVTLADIVRQRDTGLKSAIEALVGVKDGDVSAWRKAGRPSIARRVEAAAKAWSDAGALVDLDLGKATSSEARQDQISAIAGSLAEKWLDLSPEERASTLVLFPTHEMRGAFHSAVRGGLRQEGVIQGEDVPWQILRPRPLAEADRDRAVSYRTGDTLVFRGWVKRIGARPGARFEVGTIDTEKNALTLKDKQGTEFAFGLSDGAAKLPEFEVFSKAETAFAVGDKVRVLPNDPRNVLDGLEDLTITKAGPTRLEVTGRETVETGANGTERQDRTVRLSRDSTTGKLLDHAISRTVYTAQGVSAERVLAGFHSQSIMTSFANLYVIGSRAISELAIVTDNLARALQSAIRNPGVQMSAHQALELIEREHFLEAKKIEKRDRELQAEQSKAKDPSAAGWNKSDRDEERPMSEERPADFDQAPDIDIDRQPDVELGLASVRDREVGD